ncbi:hypothetical protein [Sphingomonas sp. CFBP 13720]|uniref:hypothetical protein n=1 Tax=Sphingomonas sp. CFBP 13720 TaxID=2775302 RepID=UPI00177C45AD|nr:hypothetical protein [Sphingomonas sp. CFBP 13720]MBD8677928.1 hypothetical protein [Sphingomonas sp. CFBP 13720]
MSGTTIIGTLMRADPALTALVPAERMTSGRLPSDVVLDALLIRTVSVVERLKLRRTGSVRMTERVAVTVRAKNYRSQRQIIDLVIACCAGRTGGIGGAVNVSILNAGTGPDVAGPADSFEQTQDFRVSFDAPARAAGEE